MLVPNLTGVVYLVLDYPDIRLHVDAAWLGAAFSCPEYREHCRVPAINKYADSVCVNFHKVQIKLPLLASAIVDDVYSGDWSAWTALVCGSETGSI